MDLRALRADLSGHGWTLGVWLERTLRPAPAPPSSFWSADAEDAKLGPVRLTGRLRHEASKALVLVVHGLGGDVDSPYVVAAARAAEAAGLSCLRLNLRGADHAGEDYYHVGLTADLRAALASPELAAYERVYVLGYSAGGHVSLCYGADAPDPRVSGIAAISPPLDLDAAASAFDRPGCEIYRRNVLRALSEIYANVARRRPVPIPVADAKRIRKIREWDARVVAPRYDFRSAEHYYESVSVASRLAAIGPRALVVFARNDPMVPARAVTASALGCGPRVEVRWIERGGHMAFPAKLDLGWGPFHGLEGQVLGWLTS